MPQHPSINQIFRDHVADYLRKYPKTTIHERKIIRALSICRTPEMGSRILKCDHCGNVEIMHNSCRNRHCPQCQNMKKEQWIMQRQKEVLPFTYFHLVFTLPHELNHITFANKKIVYKLLFDVCKETLLSVTADEKYFGADIGFFSILHTWGQKLNYHPHLHCVVPGGGFSQKRNKWMQAPNNYLVPVEVLKKRFCSLFLVRLKNLFNQGELFCYNNQFQSKKQFQYLIDKLFAKEWVVYLKEVFNNSNSVISYLARYTHKIAITNHRIISYHNNEVVFKYRDYKNHNRQEVTSLPVLTFMRYFLQHVVPYRFVRIRYYGLLSHRNKTKAIALCRDFFDVNNVAKEKALEWQELYLKVTGQDCNRCSQCNQGNLVPFVAILPIKYRAPPVQQFKAAQIEHFVFA